MLFRELTEKIRDANPIDEVLEENGVDLRRAAHGWSCHCPFPDHIDTRPSFSISEDGRLFFCFGCRRGGDVFRLVELLDGIDFITARRKLAERAGVAVPTARRGGSRRGD